MKPDLDAIRQSAEPGQKLNPDHARVQLFALCDEVDRLSERRALSPWQALQVVQAALLEIESGRPLSDAGRRRAFEALACVAQAVAA